MIRPRSAVERSTDRASTAVPFTWYSYSSLSGIARYATSETCWTLWRLLRHHCRTCGR